MDKTKLATMFGIETYEGENKTLLEEKQKLEKRVIELAKQLEHERAVSDEMAKDFILLAQEVNHIKADLKSYINEEAQKQIEIYDKQVKDRYRHRYFAEGRKCAYSEMGIRALEAREKGHVLYQTKDGEVIEDISADLEDVLGDDEITIDDLIELGV